MKSLSKTKVNYMKLISTSVLVLLFPIFVVGNELADKIESATDEDIEKISKLMSNKIASGLPQQIDATTIITSITFVPATKSFIYKYNSSIQLEKKNSKKYITAHMCQEPIKRALMKKGITYIHSYKLPNSIMTVEVMDSDCN